MLHVRNQMLGLELINDHTRPLMLAPSCEVAHLYGQGSVSCSRNWHNPFDCISICPVNFVVLFYPCPFSFEVHAGVARPLHPQR